MWFVYFKNFIWFQLIKLICKLLVGTKNKTWRKVFYWKKNTLKDFLLIVFLFFENTMLTSKYSWLDEILERIRLSIILKILFGLVICIGIVGNTINLLVFGSVKMRKTPVFRFLFYMSTIDLAILIMCGVETFFSMVFNIDLRVFHVFFCKFNTFLTYFLPHFQPI